MQKGHCFFLAFIVGVITFIILSSDTLFENMEGDSTTTTTDSEPAPSSPTDTTEPTTPTEPTETNPPVVLLEPEPIVEEPAPEPVSRTVSQTTGDGIRDRSGHHRGGGGRYFRSRGTGDGSLWRSRFWYSAPPYFYDYPYYEEPIITVQAPPPPAPVITPAPPFNSQSLILAGVILAIATFASSTK